MNVKRKATISCILLALAVVLGAFGAHALEGVLSPATRQVWQTASEYHFIHALGTLILMAIDRPGTSVWMNRAVVIHYVGIVIFSGSLYALAATGATWWGMVTPVGGAALVLGWIFAALGVRHIF